MRYLYRVRMAPGSFGGSALNPHSLSGNDHLSTVFVDARQPSCEARDPMGPYVKAHVGLLPNWTGLDSLDEQRQTPIYYYRDEYARNP